VYGRHPGASLALADGRGAWAREDSGPGLEFGLAQSVETLDAAFRLVHDQYVWRGFMRPHPSGRRVGRHHALPGTRVFVAMAGLRVVATATLIADSAIGLPLDEVYRQEADGLRAAGLRLGEGSALASDPAFADGGLGLVLRLMQALVIYAAEVAALDRLCVAVNPRHVGFYRRALTFDVFGELRSYASVNGAPAIALSLDLDRVRRLARTRGAHTDGARDLADFFLADHRRVAVRLAGQMRAASAALRAFRARHDPELDGADDPAPGLVARCAAE
jgi:hypothetical protein